MSDSVKTFGDICEEDRQHRLNTEAQLAKSDPVDLLYLTEEHRKFVFMVKYAAMDMYRSYTRAEINWHWDQIKDKPQFKDKIDAFHKRT